MLEQIGHGASCIVYHAVHKLLNQPCAIKCIPKTEANSRIFLKEAEFLRNLNHFFIPILYDLEEDEEFWYLIEEYIIGQSLWNLKQSQKFIPTEKLIEVSIRICEAIKYLHEKKPNPILYLDLKPDHIIITRDKIKLLDFGSAIYLRDKTIRGSITGTLGFASPEQLKGDAVDERSDVYAIGAVLYWMMTGETWTCTKTWDCIKGYPSDWNDIISKCIRQQKDERYSSVQELQKAIQSIRQKKKKRQLNKSLRIAVTGSQSRIGVTHFSIGMSIVCNRQGFSCLYEERNNSGTIEELFQNMDGVREKNGIYYFPGFEAIPKYGKAVSDDIGGERLFLMDYGAFQEEYVQEFMDVDCVIVIAGGKEWEIRRTKELIERYRKRNDIYYVLRMGGFLNFQELGKEMQLKRAFQMPCYENPFRLGRKESRFYQNIWKHLIMDVTRSR